MKNTRRLVLVLLLLVHGLVVQQLAYQPSPLDPTRTLPSSAEPAHAALAEQYLWTAGDVTAKRPDRNQFPWARTELRTAPHLFRAHFNVASLPTVATLYLAGPREAHVYLNGQLLRDFATNIDEPINFRVFHVDVSRALMRGENVLAIEAIRGRGVVTATGTPVTQQLGYGEVLVAKLIGAGLGSETPVLAISNPAWRSLPVPDHALLPEHWADANFDESAWKPVASLGPIESNVDFFQWSVDAGMYAWPGYSGVSPHLHSFALAPAAVTHVFAGAGRFDHLEALTDSAAGSTFQVTLPDAPASDADAPQILLDFGREVAGRLLVESASSTGSTLSIAYGESALEALATGTTTSQQGGNYLGTNLLEVPAHGTARGPKSGFRYVRVRFLKGSPAMAFKSIRLEGIYEPQPYAGSFESSDSLLNRIWETGAYTVHLCMQDGLWDAPKRDRGRWIGDIDVEGRVISTVFGASDLLNETLRLIADGTEPGQHVSGIPSYSALWLTSLENVYRHTGDLKFLNSQHAAILRILEQIDASVGATGLVSAELKSWGFVDWSPSLYGFTPEAGIGTDMQYVRGLAAGARLLKALGDDANAARYANRTQAMKTAAAVAYLDAKTGTAGRTWQLNALAVLANLDARADSRIWTDVLAHVKQDSPGDQVVSPYFSTYLLDAMSVLGHQREALDWIRTYWGGMLAEGATSFWESYDLRWPKTNPELSLQADGTSGFFVSMAHGWSSGPTAWLSENVLGVTPASPGYQMVDLHPDLLGLEFARGTVPTPHGPIAISIRSGQGIDFDLPPGIDGANVTLPPGMRGHAVLVDGRPSQPGIPIKIQTAGHHSIAVLTGSQPPSSANGESRPSPIEPALASAMVSR